MSQVNSIYSLLKEAAEHFPEAPAILGVDRKPMTYLSLIEQVEATVASLNCSGIGRNSRVAVVVENGPEAAVCSLAISSGAAYAPLNPAYSQAEFEFYLQDLSPGALVVDPEINSPAAAVARALNIPVMELKVSRTTAGVFQLNTGGAGSSAAPSSFAEPDDVALLLHTSGSTSRPKLVPITQQAMCESARVNREALGLTTADRSLNIMPLFHLHGLCFAVLSSLMAGSSVVCSPGFHALHFFEWLSAFQPTWYTAGPTMHQAILARAGENLDSIAHSRLRFIRSGASGLPSSVMRQLEETFKIPVIEAYAMTETGLIAINRLPPGTRKPGSVGVPVGCEVSVMDESLRPLPAGTAGNIAVRSSRVTRGYMNRPDANQKAFIDGWFYTGDQGRFDPDGYLFLTGRTSEIINRGGEKISPWEIDEALIQHPAVRQAMAFGVPHPTLGEQVAACVVLQPHLATTDQDAIEFELQQFVAQRLAAFKVPYRIAFVAEIPKGPTGKPQRNSLAARTGLMDAHSAGQGDDLSATVPRNVIEQRLVAIWKEVLKRDAIGCHDNFFQSGGDSIFGAQMIARATAEFGIAVPLFLLFRNPTIAGLAEWLQSARKHGAPEAKPLTSVARPERLPLSYAQQRLWFLSQMEDVSKAYHIAYGARLKGRLESAALRRSLDCILARHEALRTAFIVMNGEPLQRIMAGDDSRFDLKEIDLRPSRNAEKQLERLLAQEANTPFDLEAGPLIRGKLIRLGEEEYVLLITMHHVVSDGWSMGVLLSEMSALYAAFLHGRANPLPELSVQYADYALWQREWMQGEILQQQANYWRTALKDAPAVLELPMDHSHPAMQDYAGNFCSVALGERLCGSLRKLSQSHGVTLFMTLLAGWAVLLMRLSGQQDIVVGTPVANRTRSEIENLIGYFANTLAIRLDLSGQPAVGELLARVKARVLGAQQHQDIPFEQVVEAVQPARNLAHNPLFQVVFAWQNVPQGALTLPGLELQPLDLTHPRNAKFDLLLTLKEENGQIAGTLEYATSLFKAITMERYLGYFAALLEAMAADDSSCIDRLSMLDEEERREIVYTWNRKQAEYPGRRCIHELFEQQVEESPQATAVVDDGKALTYEELNRRANRLAHYLQRLGVGPEARVAICLERGLEMVIGILAVLKAGAAYIPLDPAYPAERLRYMLEDSAPLAVLTQTPLQKLFAGAEGWTALVDMGMEGPWKNQPETNLDAVQMGLRPEHLAYIIYTSGSTGTPKGVMVTHDNVTRLFRATETSFGFTKNDVWTLFHSCAFDFSVWEIWGALLYGGRLIVVSQQAARSAEEFYELLCREQVSILNQTPTTFRQLMAVQRLSRQRHGVRYVIFGGEMLEAGSLRPWYERKENHSTELVNMYGITETTVHVTRRVIEERETRGNCKSPIGRRIGDLEIYILDEWGEPEPVGVAGEIYVGGAGVTRGYLNRPELTAERFVVNPFTSQAGARMYRSGDVGKWLEDGSIEFVGRNDSQVKIRGYRIELGEIEARLAEHAGVREAVVVAREDGGGEKRLVAYWTASGEGGTELGAEQLRAHVASHLPEYMVPAAYVELEELPLTANGKLDRKGLPEPGGEAYVAAKYEEPVGEVEKKLAEIWAEVLKVERVGRHDNFFQLGGHSLMTVGLIERMRSNGIGVDVRAIFASPVLSELAANAGRNNSWIEVPPNLIPAQCDRITPEMLSLVHLTAEKIERLAEKIPGGMANVQDIYPLAPLQEGIFFHYLLSEEGDAYLLAHLLSFDTRTRLERYIEAVQKVVDRHDTMRTCVLWEDLPEAVQVVQRQAVLAVEEVELDEKAGEADQQLYARFDPRKFRIDIRQAPLLRLYTAYDKQKDRWLMMVLHHHIIDDNTTLRRMQEEIRGYLLGMEAPPPSPPFRNLVAQARLGVSREDHEAYFRRLLGDVEEPTAPFGLLGVQGTGSDIEQTQLRLDATLDQRIRKSARKLGVSAASLCHLAWAAVLAKISGRTDVVFGTVLFGRMQSGAGDRTLGPFINTLPLRIQVGKEGVESGVRRTHALLAALMRHEHASLAWAQRCSAVPAPVPLFSALLNYRHNPTSAALAETRQVTEGVEWLYRVERSNYPLALSVDNLAEGFRLTVQVKRWIGGMRVCEYMRTALESLIDALESEPDTPVRALKVLPDAERHQVLHEWNKTKMHYESDLCVHELLHKQATRTPEAVAVVCKDASLTFGELNRRANQLAHYLRKLGVKPEERVAICVERGLEMIVGLLAILKAGGAYVPLDPESPDAHLRHIMENSAPAVFLTQGPGPRRFAKTQKTVPVLDLGDALPAWRKEPETNLDTAAIGIASRHLAYIIYTSGSTGTPKGVAVEHLSLANLIHWHRKAFALESGQCSSSVAGFGFDASTWEIWPTLCAGGVLWLPSAADMQDPEALLAWWEQQSLDISFLPTPMAEFAFTRHITNPYLHKLLIGGDQLRRLPDKPPSFSLINNYGPTETTVVATSGCIEMSARVLSIGRPIANTRLYILDQSQEPAPVGVAGEMYIGGAGVTRGYLNRPELTAERFLPDPFVEKPGARMYRSGDVGKWLEDGSIEFVGRNDSQVKIRGYRIELGEIEARLAEHAGVREAVVVAREDGGGEKRLVAYWTASGEGGTELGAEQLRAHVASHLPEYMVPAAYVELEELPLTANGKLDRKGLPEPGGEAYVAAKYEEPVGEVEKKLAEIWAEVLKVERVGRHDNFFQLGGHSLIAVRATARLRQVLDMEIKVADLFARPVLGTLAEHLISLQLDQFDPKVLEYLSKTID
jgi:amino acid adenylation domain-containing protein